MDWIKENHIILATCSVAVAVLQVNEIMNVPKNVLTTINYET